MRREKDKVAAEKAQIVSETLIKVSDEIRHNDKETLILVDAKTGKEIGRTTGEPNDVGDLPSIIDDNMAGNIEIHNHPDLSGDTDVPPSWPDLQGFLEGDSKALIVVTPGYDFTITLPPGTTSKDRTIIKKTFRSIIPKGAHPVVTHEHWVELAKRTKLIYKKEKPQ